MADLIMATPPDPSTSTDPNAQQVRISTANVQTTYVNFCRGTLTPEEIVLDLGFNANGFGIKVLEEDLEIRQRIILSPGTAKRLLFQLNEMVRRHEQNFGEVEMDFRRSLKPTANGAAPQP